MCHSDGCSLDSLVSEGVLVMIANDYTLLCMYFEITIPTSQKSWNSIISVWFDTWPKRNSADIFMWSTYLILSHIT